MLEKFLDGHEGRGSLGVFIKKQQEQEIPVKPTIGKLKCKLHTIMGLNSFTRTVGG